MLRRSAVRTCLAGALLAALPVVGSAEDLPPAESPPFTGVYHMTTRSKVDATDDWTFFDDDTVTIATLHKQSRWDYKKDGHTLLVDSVGRFSTVFGGKNPPNTAFRSQSDVVAIGWEFGYATIKAATPDKQPEVLGTTTIAGRECTRLRFDSEVYGKPEFCVDKTGIVLRFANASPTAEATFEAQSIDAATPASDRFTTPAGYNVQMKSKPRRDIKF